MGVIEIAIIAAAGIFLLWLWRGGGQPKPVLATADCAAQRCGPARPFGCLGVLFALMIATGLLLIGFRSHNFAGIGLALFAGMALLLFAGRWGRGIAVLGMFALAGLTVLGMLTFGVIRAASQHAEQDKLHWVDDLLDGPAARFSPFHRAQLERARAELQREQARNWAEINRWKSLARMRSQDGRLPIPVELSPYSTADDLAGVGATLFIDLKPNALSQGNVSPDALAATVLTVVDLIAASGKEGDTAPVTLSMLYRMDVQPRSGKAIPLSQIARIRKESRKGVADRIARIAVTTNDKSQRPEGEQIRQACEYLVGIEHTRQSQRGHGGFQVGYSDSSLLIVVEPKSMEGIPVEAELAAATPEPPSAALPPAVLPAVNLPAAASVPPALPAAPLPLAVAAPKARLKTPVEGSVLDLWAAYQLLMWTLPESLGGAAEFKQATYELVPVAAGAPPVVEVAQAPPAEPGAVAAVTPAPVVTAPPAPVVAPTPAPEAASAPTPAAVVRPAWLTGKTEYLDSQGDYCMRRSTGRLYQSADESHEAAAELLVEMSRDYVISLLGKDAASRVSIPIHTVLHDFFESTWDEEGPPPGLPDDDAWETHVLLKFDAADRQLVEQAWRHSVVDKNMRYAGAGAGLLLALLGTVFGYLKVDTATRGYYSGRLKLATGAIVAAITTVGILLVAGTWRL